MRSLLEMIWSAVAESIPRRLSELRCLPSADEEEAVVDEAVLPSVVRLCVVPARSRFCASKARRESALSCCEMARSACRAELWLIPPRRSPGVAVVGLVVAVVVATAGVAVVAVERRAWSAFLARDTKSFAPRPDPSGRVFTLRNSESTASHSSLTLLNACGMGGSCASKGACSSLAVCAPPRQKENDIFIRAPSLSTGR